MSAADRIKHGEARRAAYERIRAAMVERRAFTDVDVAAVLDWLDICREEHRRVSTHVPRRNDLQARASRAARGEECE